MAVKQRKEEWRPRPDSLLRVHVPSTLLAVCLWLISESVYVPTHAFVQAGVDMGQVWSWPTVEKCGQTQSPEVALTNEEVRHAGGTDGRVVTGQDMRKEKQMKSIESPGPLLEILSNLRADCKKGLFNYVGIAKTQNYLKKAPLFFKTGLPHVDLCFPLFSVV